MFGGHIHAYGVRVPEVQFDKPHLPNPSNALAPPLPPQATHSISSQLSSHIPRSPQDSSRSTSLPSWRREPWLPTHASSSILSL